MNEKERMIIDKRFFMGKTQMEVADEIGISQAQVSRLEKSAISMHIMNVKKLKRTRLMTLPQEIRLFLLSSFAFFLSDLLTKGFDSFCDILCFLSKSAYFDLKIHFF